MSGSVLDVRYKLLSRQVETLYHLQAACDKFLKTGKTRLGDEGLAVLDCRRAAEVASKSLRPFAEKYADGYANDSFADFQTLEDFQRQTATVTGTLLSRLLIPGWHKEIESLIHVDAHPSGDASPSELQTAWARVPEHIRNAEELVCITYLGFVQNVLGRLRTMVLSLMWLFVAITLSVSMYPFDPRPGLNQALVVVFLAVGGLVIYVYAEMHRDTTLSRVTNTTPGELGVDFWVKMLTFGAGPFLGLVAYLFPGITDFLFSWLEPSLAAVR